MPKYDTHSDTSELLASTGRLHYLATWNIRSGESGIRVPAEEGCDLIRLGDNTVVQSELNGDKSRLVFWDIPAPSSASEQLGVVNKVAKNQSDDDDWDDGDDSVFSLASPSSCDGLSGPPAPRSRPPLHRLRRSLSGHAGDINRICHISSIPSRLPSTFANPLGFLASASKDNSVRVWSIDSMQSRAVLAGHSSDVYGVCWVPSAASNGHLVSAGWDMVARMWDLEKGTEVAAIGPYLGEIVDSRYLGSAESGISDILSGCFAIVGASGDHTVRLYDARAIEGSLVSTSAGAMHPVDSCMLSLRHQVGVYCVTRLRDTSKPMVFSGDHAGNIALWDLRRTEAPISSVRRHADSVWDIVQLPRTPRGMEGDDGGRNTLTFASSGYDSKVKFWNVSAALDSESFQKRQLDRTAALRESGISRLLQTGTFGRSVGGVPGGARLRASIMSTLSRNAPSSTIRQASAILGAANSTGRDSGNPIASREEKTLDAGGRTYSLLYIGFEEWEWGEFPAKDETERFEFLWGGGDDGWRGQPGGGAGVAVRLLFGKVTVRCERSFLIELT